MHRGLRGQYEDSREAGREAVRRGELPKARDHYERSVTLARQIDDPALVHAALCDRAVLQIEIGEVTDAMPTLRRILMQNVDPELSFLAAYTLSRGYELGKDLDKASFYAQVAHRHSLSLTGWERQSQSFNQLGNLALAASEFETALPHLEQALALLPKATSAAHPSSVPRALILDNLGYCRSVLGSSRKAFHHLFTSLRLLLRLKARALEGNPRLSLAHAYLQVGRADRAWQHARRALDLADELGDRENQKYAFFLLGEAEKLRGNPLAARHYFHLLQEEFYPESPEVPDLLLFINVQQIVNLRA